MVFRFWHVALLAIAPASLVPAALSAQPISSTRDKVSFPAKASAERPSRDSDGSAVAKCHPDATKALMCKAAARLKKAQAAQDAASRDSL
ncbi:MULTISPECIES: hypothetical protein [Sphingobium]|uniref:Uncharacterized protein n=1 Tax=Sphingobium lignivorans TaxID=2735886 RepID=A0ABR6NCX3_9SPHN|nr:MULTISPECIES: hypothetical protein [Sphingobium]MBB5985120.1 hypothetical protein [Sphingobium lignivorans]BAK65831.1 hypothetical protein SLG_11560 [Sphingobium sp. SYK-6]